jgi:protein-tyrosine phosphatase
MRRVIDGLYLGNREDARDLAGLEAVGVTHVVNCAEELPDYHEGTLTYLGLNLRDPDPAVRDHIDRTCAFIDAARKEGKAVLVHCFAAISRAPSTVLAYLCHLGDSVEAAARKLAAVAWTDPDVLFIKQVAEHSGMKVTDRDLERLSLILTGRRLERDTDEDVT